MASATGSLQSVVPVPTEPKKDRSPRDNPHANALAYYRFEGDATSMLNAVTGADDGKRTASITDSTPLPFVPLSGDANHFALDTLASGGTAEFTTKFPLHERGDVTLEFWLFPAGQGHETVIWSRHASVDVNRFNLWTERGTFGCDYRSPSGVLHEILPADKLHAPIKEWTHVAIVRAGKTYRCYENGKQVHEHIDMAPDLPTEAGWTISGRAGFPFHGRIDEVRFTAKPLRPSEFLSFGR